MVKLLVFLFTQTDEKKTCTAYIYTILVRMVTSIKSQLMKSGRQTNIKKYRVTAHIYFRITFQILDRCGRNIWYLILSYAFTLLTKGFSHLIRVYLNSNFRNLSWIFSDISSDYLGDSWTTRESLENHRHHLARPVIL